MTEHGAELVRGSPTRCPYCHEGIDPSGGEAWIACVGCLARHHDACWKELRRCGACGAEEVLRPEAADPAPSRRKDAPAPSPFRESPGLEFLLTQDHVSLALGFLAALAFGAAGLLATALREAGVGWAVVPVVAFGIVVVAGLALRVRALRAFALRGERVTGRVAAVMPWENDRRASVVYGYTYRGRAHQLTVRGVPLERARLGREVFVLVDPERPSRAFVLPY